MATLRRLSDGAMAAGTDARARLIPLRDLSHLADASHHVAGGDEPRAALQRSAAGFVGQSCSAASGSGDFRETLARWRDG